MNKEYILNSFIIDFFASLDDFMGNFPSIYTLIDSQSDRRVYHNISESLDLIFYTRVNRILLLVTTNYDSSKEVWYQDNIIVAGYDYARSNIREDGSNYVENCAYYFPVPTLSEGNRLIANYNEENDTFMFSVIRDIVFNYGYTQATVYRTMNLVFGNSTKYLDFDGGFFYGGDFVYTYERFYREDKNGIAIGDGVAMFFDSEFKYMKFHVQPRPRNYVGYWSSPWLLDGYANRSLWQRGSNLDVVPDANRTNRLDIFMRIDMDNAPNRKKNDVVEANPKCNMPLVYRNKLWAITIDIDYYIPMVCSITYSTKSLPKYESLISHDYLEKGHIVNTLNNISLLMPLWFMVHRDPEELNSYSAVSRNDVINLVSMYNICSGRIENGTFPVKEHKYQCFQMGNRRAMFGMKGYNGLAFKQSEKESPAPPPHPNLSLLDIDAMESHKTGGSDILNIEMPDGTKGYGGDTRFDDMPTGSFILKRPYTEFSSITFTFCNDGGDITDTVVWSRADLDAALAGTTVFNLLPVGSPVTWGSSPGQWNIQPFSGGSTSTVFICSYQNCGLIGAMGSV